MPSFAPPFLPSVFLFFALLALPAFGARTLSALPALVLLRVLPALFLPALVLPVRPHKGGEGWGGGGGGGGGAAARTAVLNRESHARAAVLHSCIVARTDAEKLNYSRSPYLLSS